MTNILKCPDGRIIDFDNLPSLDSVLDDELHKLAEQSGLTFEFIKNGDYNKVRKALGFNNKPVIPLGFRGQYLNLEEVKEKEKELRKYIKELYRD